MCVHVRVHLGVGIYLRNWLTLLWNQASPKSAAGASRLEIQEEPALQFKSKGHLMAGFLLLKPTTHWTRPTHIMEGILLHSKSMHLTVNPIPKTHSQKHPEQRLTKYLGVKLPRTRLSACSPSGGLGAWLVPGGAAAVGSQWDLGHCVSHELSRQTTCNKCCHNLSSGEFSTPCATPPSRDLWKLASASPLTASHLPLPRANCALHPFAAINHDCECD